MLNNELKPWGLTGTDALLGCSDILLRLRTVKYDLKNIVSNVLFNLF